jgi:Na+/melibiose symporter-like transporter
MKAIIRFLAGSCHSILTLPVMALLLKGVGSLQAEDWAAGGVWLISGIAALYLWYFGGRYALNWVHRRTEPAGA